MNMATGEQMEFFKMAFIVAAFFVVASALGGFLQMVADATSILRNIAVILCMLAVTFVGIVGLVGLVGFALHNKELIFTKELMKHGDKDTVKKDN